VARGEILDQRGTYDSSREGPLGLLGATALPNLEPGAALLLQRLSFVDIGPGGLLSSVTHGGRHRVPVAEPGMHWVLH